MIPDQTTPAPLVIPASKRRAPGLWLLLTSLLVSAGLVVWGTGFRPSQIWANTSSTTLSFVKVDEGPLALIVVENGTLESSNNTKAICQVEAIIGLVGGAQGAAGKGGAQGKSGGQGGQGGERGEGGETSPETGPPHAKAEGGPKKKGGGRGDRGVRGRGGESQAGTGPRLRPRRRRRPRLRGRRRPPRRPGRQRRNKPMVRSRNRCRKRGARAGAPRKSSS